MTGFSKTGSFVFIVTSISATTEELLHNTVYQYSDAHKARKKKE